MKIIRVIARLNVGGPARHVVWLTAGMRQAGHEALLVAGSVPANEADMSYFASGEGVEPVVIPEMSREISPADLVAAWKLYRLLRRERPDIVHTHTAKAGTVGRIAGFLYRWFTPSILWSGPRSCRLVHTYHGHVFHSYYGQLKTKLFLVVERTLAQLATDRIVVISPQQFKEIHEEFGVGRREQFRVVPLGLDLERFAGAERRRNRLRDELGVKPDELLVGIIGRLTEIKNHKLFLAAAAHYSGDETKPALPARFVVIGDGHLRSALEAEAQRLNLGSKVIFTGARDDPEFFYPALDVVALTSLNEGTPLTLIEAMANSRPVIATAVGGVTDLLGASEATHDDLTQHDGFRVCERGILVTQQNPAVFANALRRLLANRELRRGLGERGRRFVRDGYSKERLLDDISRLYEELLGGVPAQQAGGERSACVAHMKGE